jgi:hypothetical protein
MDINQQIFGENYYSMIEYVKSKSVLDWSDLIRPIYTSLDCISSLMFDKSFLEDIQKLENIKHTMDPNIFHYTKVCIVGKHNVIKMKEILKKYQVAYDINYNIKQKIKLNNNIKTRTTTNTKNETNTDIKLETKTNTKNETNTDIKLETKTNTKNESNTDIKLGTKTNIKSESNNLLEKIRKRRNTSTFFHM